MYSTGKNTTRGDNADSVSLLGVGVEGESRKRSIRKRKKAEAQHRQGAKDLELLGSGPSPNRLEVKLPSNIVSSETLAGETFRRVDI